jgi:hypothetical protein
MGLIIKKSLQNHMGAPLHLFIQRFPIVGTKSAIVGDFNVINKQNKHPIFLNR